MQTLANGLPSFLWAIVCDNYCAAPPVSYRPGRFAFLTAHRAECCKPLPMVCISYCLPLSANISKGNANGDHAPFHGMGADCFGMLQRTPQAAAPWYALECYGMLQGLTDGRPWWYLRARLRVRFLYWRLACLALVGARTISPLVASIQRPTMVCGDKIGHIRVPLRRSRAVCFQRTLKT